MNKALGVFTLIFLCLTSCTTGETSTHSSNDQTKPETQSVEEVSTIPVETSGPDCLGPEIHPVAQEIANQFEETSYDKVMTWFCNGAEFEDILVALQTEKDTGEPAEDFLKLIAEGQTWDEIWDAVGLTD